PVPPVAQLRLLVGVQLKELFELLSSAGSLPFAEQSLDVCLGRPLIVEDIALHELGLFQDCVPVPVLLGQSSQRIVVGHHLRVELGGTAKVLGGKIWAIGTAGNVR